jgi:hypothetical protein
LTATVGIVVGIGVLLIILLIGSIILIFFFMKRQERNIEKLPSSPPENIESKMLEDKQIPMSEAVAISPNQPNGASPPTNQ